MIVANAVVGGWALAAHWHERLRVRALWWCTIAAEVAIFVQVVLGVAVMNVDGVKAPGFHLLYGFTAFLTVGIIYSYRAQLASRLYLLYGLGGLFLMGLGVRAVQVGTGVR